MERIGQRLPMLARQMQINQGMFQAGVSQQELNGTQIRSRVEPMGGPAVAQAVRGEALGDARSLGCGTASVPDSVGTDGYVGTAVVYGSGEEIG